MLCACRACASKQRTSTDISLVPTSNPSSSLAYIHITTLFFNPTLRDLCGKNLESSWPQLCPPVCLFHAACVVLRYLGIVFVALRFYTRALQKKSTGIDDWLMLPALVCVS